MGEKRKNEKGETEEMNISKNSSHYLDENQNPKPELQISQTVNANLSCRGSHFPYTPLLFDPLGVK